LKSAFVALNNSTNKPAVDKNQESKNGALDSSHSDIEAAEDDTDDIDTVRMLLEL